MEPQDPTHPFSETPPPRQEVVPSPPPSPPSSLQPEAAPRPTGGRPLRLTQEVHDRIVEAVEQGSYLKIAAQAAGVGQSTLAAWLARGREAASLLQLHEDETRRYCPDCDLDRTDEVRDRDEQQEQLDAEYAEAVEQWRARMDAVDAGAPDDGSGIEEPPAHTGVALDRCPRCSSQEEPVQWHLPADEAPFLELLESVTRAQATAETEAVAAWRRAFSGHDPDWRAARDFLARTSPERWAGVTRVQMTTEEAERRIDDAVNEALLAIGVDLPVDEADLALDEPGEVADDARSQ